MKKQLKVLMIFTLLVILIGANTNRAMAATPTMTIGPDNLWAEYTKQYSQQLGVIGGVEPYAFSIVSGNLPSGFTLSSGGLISGFAEGEGALPGVYPIEIKVVDANGETATRGYDFVVDKGIPTMTASAANPSYWNRQLILWAYVSMLHGDNSFDYLGGTVAFFVDENPVTECQAVPLVDSYYSCKVAASTELNVGSHTVRAVFTPADGEKYYPADASSEFTVQPVHFMIMGAVFDDKNQNGIMDYGEYGVGAGWSVYLDRECDGTTDETILTGNTGGYYQFLNITAGYWYCVSTEVRPGYQLTSELPKVWLIDNVVSMHVGYYYPNIVLSPYDLASVNLGNTIYQEFTASGGADPYTYRISWGTLPDGLSFSEAGVLSGIPTAAGSTTIEIEAKDANQAVRKNYYQILVKADGVFTFTSSSNPSFLGDSVTFTVSASGDVIDPNYGQIPPYGAITFYVDGYENEDCSYLYLNQGEGGIGDYPVTCVMSTLELGSHQITAKFTSFSDLYNVPTLALTQTVQSGQSADLAIQKTEIKNPVKPGAKLVYILKVSNSGPDTAQNPILVDMLDSNTTFASTVAPKGWTCGYVDSVVTCTGSTMAMGKTANITITAIVKKTASIGQELVNTASVTSTTYDPNMTNNSITQTNMVRK